MSSGERCPKCSKGQMRVRTSRQAGEYQEQRLECSKCDHEAKTTVKADRIFRRKR